MCCEKGISFTDKDFSKEIRVEGLLNSNLVLFSVGFNEVIVDFLEKEFRLFIFVSRCVGQNNNLLLRIEID
jgi:hypothetical protein